MSADCIRRPSLGAMPERRMMMHWEPIIGEERNNPFCSSSSFYARRPSTRPALALEGCFSPFYELCRQVVPVKVEQRADARDHQEDSIWKVVGSFNRKDGLQVREGSALDSQKYDDLLLLGSLVRERGTEWVSSWKRMHYELLKGGGPAEGWVTMINDQDQACLVRATYGAPPTHELKWREKFETQRAQTSGSAGASASNSSSWSSSSTPASSSTQMVHAWSTPTADTSTPSSSVPWNLWTAAPPGRGGDGRWHAGSLASDRLALQHWMARWRPMANRRSSMAAATSTYALGGEAARNLGRADRDMLWRSLWHWHAWSQLQRTPQTRGGCGPAPTGASPAWRIMDTDVNQLPESMRLWCKRWGVEITPSSASGGPQPCHGQSGAVVEDAEAEGRGARGGAAPEAPPPHAGSGTGAAEGGGDTGEAAPCPRAKTAQQKHEEAPLYIEYYCEDIRSYRVQNLETGEVFDRSVAIDDRFMHQVRDFERSHKDRVTLGHFVRTNEYTTERLISFAKVDSSSVVLDIGCGEGEVLRKLVQLTGCRCIGIEANPLLCRKAERHNKKHKVDDRIEIREMMAEELRIEDLRNVTMAFIFVLNESKYQPLVPLFLGLLKQEATIVANRFQLPKTGFQHTAEWPPDDTLEGILELMSPSSPMLFKYQGWKSVITPGQPLSPARVSANTSDEASSPARVSTSISDETFSPARVSTTTSDDSDAATEVSNDMINNAITELGHFLGDGVRINRRHCDCMAEMLRVATGPPDGRMPAFAVVALMVALVSRVYQFGYLQEKYPASVGRALRVFERRFADTSPGEAEVASTVCEEESDVASLADLDWRADLVSGLLGASPRSDADEREDEDIANVSDAESVAELGAWSAAWDCAPPAESKRAPTFMAMADSSDEEWDEEEEEEAWADGSDYGGDSCEILASGAAAHEDPLFVEYYVHEIRSYRYKNAETGEVFEDISSFEDAFMERVRAYEAAHSDRVSFGHFVRTSSCATDRLIAFGGITADTVLLDIGCGDGETLRRVVLETSCACIGVEVNPLLCIKARRQNRLHKLDDRIDTREMRAEDLRAEELRHVNLAFIFVLNETKYTPLVPLFQQLLAQGCCIVTNRFPLPQDAFQPTEVWPPEDKLEGILELMSPSCTVMYKYQGSAPAAAGPGPSPAGPPVPSSRGFRQQEVPDAIHIDIDDIDGAACDVDCATAPCKVIDLCSCTTGGDDAGEATVLHQDIGSDGTDDEDDGGISDEVIYDEIFCSAIHDARYFLCGSEGGSFEHGHFACLGEMLQAAHTVAAERMPVHATVALLVALATKKWDIHYLQQKYPESATKSIDVFFTHFRPLPCDELASVADMSDADSLEEHGALSRAMTDGMLSLFPGGSLCMPGSADKEEEGEEEEIISESDAASLADFDEMLPMWRTALSWCESSPR